MSNARDIRVNHDKNFATDSAIDTVEIRLMLDAHLRIGRVPFDTMRQRSQTLRDWVAVNPSGRVLDLSHVSITTMSMYLKYIDRGVIACKHRIKSPDEPDFDDQLHDLVLLYILALELQDEDAMDAVTTCIVTAYLEAVHLGQEALPKQRTLHLASYGFHNHKRIAPLSWPPFGNIPEDSSLVRLLVDILWFQKTVLETGAYTSKQGAVSKAIFRRMILSAMENPMIIGRGAIYSISCCKYHRHAANAPCRHVKKQVGIDDGRRRDVALNKQQQGLTDQDMLFNQGTTSDQGLAFNQETSFNQGMSLNDGMAFNQSMPLDQSMTFNQSMPYNQGMQYNYGIEPPPTEQRNDSPRTWDADLGAGMPDFDSMFTEQWMD